MDKEDILKEFDEKFGEDFYDLHYRFCKIADTEKNEVCSRQKEQLKSEIVGYLLSTISKVLEEVKEDVYRLPTSCSDGMEWIGKTNCLQLLDTIIKKYK